MDLISRETGAPKEEEEEEEEEEATVDGKTTEGPLWIKLRIPKSGHHHRHRELSKEGPLPPNSPLEKGFIKQKEEDFDHDHDHDLDLDINIDPQQRQKAKEERICRVCKKGFSSGKALGGHVRIHVQVQAHHHTNKPIQSKKIKNNATAPSNLTLLFNKKLEEQQQQEDDVDPEGGGGGRSSNKRHVCIVCGKNFKSEKSLFGHMRCHPERPWRGIHPPSDYSPPRHHPASDPLHIPHPKTSSSSTLSSDNRNPPPPHQIDLLQDRQMIDSAATTTMAVDLSRALRVGGWSKTDRRGRKQLISNSNSAPVPAYDPCSVSASSSRCCEWEFEEEEEDAAHELMCLSYHPPHSNQFLHPHHQEEEAAAAAAAAEARANALTNEAVVKMETNNGSKKRLIRSLINDDDELQEQPCDDDDTKNKKTKESQNENTQKTEKKKRKRRRQVKIRDLGTVVIRDGGIVANTIIPPASATTIAANGQDHEMGAALPEDRFKCSTCSKTFPTHQALGGHRSSHNKLLLKHTTVPIPHDHHRAPTEEEEEKRESGPLIVEQEDDDVNKKKNNKNKNKNKNHHDSIAVEEEEEECDTGEDPQYNDLESTQHLCRICNKSFSTGQALGGHMRCHYYLPAEIATTPATPTTAVAPPPNTWTSPSLSHAGGHGGGGGKIALSFDLNELPAFEEEEGKGEGDEEEGMAMAMAWKTGGRICE